MDLLRSVRCSDQRGFTFLELAVALSLFWVVVVPMVGMGAELRSRALLRHSVEEAAGLLARARWAAVTLGGSTVEFAVSPPLGRLLSPAGDTLIVTDLGAGGVVLRLSREQAATTILFGPLGLGIVASRTIRFAHGGNEAALIVSALGRVRRP